MARILVVDDQDDKRDSLATVLAREGHEVIAVTDGAGALSSMKGEDFDLMMAELKMPGIAGVELLIQAKELRPEIPVVFMTAVETLSDAVAAMKLGAYDYIQQPFDADQIKHLVGRTLEHHRLIRENQALRRMAEACMPRPLVAGDDLAVKPLADIEKQVILSTLEQFKGHRIRTATALGIGVRTLGMKLKRWREEGEPIGVGA